MHEIVNIVQYSTSLSLSVAWCATTVQGCQLGGRVAVWGAVALSMVLLAIAMALRLTPCICEVTYINING